MCHKIGLSKLLHNIAEFSFFCTEVLDGKEVSENERHFLFSWKAMKKARHRQLIQQSLLDNTDVEVCMIFIILSFSAN